MAKTETVASAQTSVYTRAIVRRRTTSDTTNFGGDRTTRDRETAGGKSSTPRRRGASGLTYLLFSEYLGPPSSIPNFFIYYKGKGTKGRCIHAARGDDREHAHTFELFPPAVNFAVAVVRSPPKFVVSLVVLRRTTERV